MLRGRVCFTCGAALLIVVRVVRYCALENNPPLTSPYEHLHYRAGTIKTF